MRGALGSRADDIGVVDCGVGLSRVRTSAFAGPVIVCGLAGGLAADADTGTVVIADRAMDEDGHALECDRELSERFAAAAARLGISARTGTILSSRTLVTGTARATWAARGYLAVDMETAFVHAPRIACVRVVLDTAAHELSDAWLRPWTVPVRPDAWPQFAWLVREGPRCARLAARVLAKALLDGD